MRTRLLAASLFALALTGASSAAAQDLSLEALMAQGACPEMPVCGSCKADIDHSGQGAAVETEHDRHVFVNNAAGRSSGAPAAPGAFQPRPSQASADYYLHLDGVEGESSARPRGEDGVVILNNTAPAAGGVSVAVGDVTGDGAAGRAHAPVRPIRE